MTAPRSSRSVRCVVQDSDGQKPTISSHSAQSLRVVPLGRERRWSGRTLPLALISPEGPDREEARQASCRPTSETPEAQIQPARTTGGRKTPPCSDPMGRVARGVTPTPPESGGQEGSEGQWVSGFDRLSAEKQVGGSVAESSSLFRGGRLCPSYTLGVVSQW